MAIGTNPRSIGTVNSVPLTAIKDAIQPALRDLSDRHGMVKAELFVDHASDCIQLIAVDNKGRAFSHPRFITRHEVEDRTWFGVVAERFESTVNGFPTNRRQPIMPDTTFSLNELEWAQDYIDTLK